MAIVKKITIGIAPFAKMFRIPALGGVAVDAVLRLRSKSLPDDYFEEVATDADRRTYRVAKSDAANTLVLSEDSISFTKDYYGTSGSFDYSKVLGEFKTIWAAVNKVLTVQDVRRIGIVGEYRYQVSATNPSAWMRDKFTTFGPIENRVVEKMNIRFEERQLATDGKAPDPLKSDFINYIYSYYDSNMDAQHPEPGYVSATLDVQRYFTPVMNGDVGDEVQKLNKYYSAAERTLDGYLKSLGASSGKT